jgi:ABC-type lipoprotein export system ATPase subunit
MIEALNVAEPAAFALMDYWSFDGWFALKDRLAEGEGPQLRKLVLPGIELRLTSPTDCRLNAHVVFSDRTPDQSLRDFLSKLEVDIMERPLSEASLVELARVHSTPDILKTHGFKKEVIDESDEQALLAGSRIAEISLKSYRDAIASVPGGLAIGFMPFDTNDGLKEVDWHEHYAYFMKLFRSSPIFESRKPDLQAAFNGVKTEGNAKWFEAFFDGLGKIPRLVVSGSDAHAFSDYGKFHSGKATWIKADTTFLGLKQALREPARRSFIGDRPSKLVEVSENKTFYIDSIEISRNPKSKLQEFWLDGCRLPLNTELVAIIGNKGSGKSALADVLALLGNSNSDLHFSFLSKSRFRQQPAMLAQHFSGQLTWLDGEKGAPLSLDKNAAPGSPELVRYIPQQYFEDLCNEHVSGKSDKLEQELRSVIFSHTSSAIRQDALNFDQLTDREERTYREQLAEYRKELSKVNKEIESVERQLHPDERRKIDELVALKRKQIEEHNKIQPKEPSKPTEELTPEQRAIATELETIAQRLSEAATKQQQLVKSQTDLSNKSRANQLLRERLALLRRQVGQFQTDSQTDFATLGLALADVVTFSINEEVLDESREKLEIDKRAVAENEVENAESRKLLASSQESLKAKLAAPQQEFQAQLKAMLMWKERMAELVGSTNIPDSLEGLNARIAQLDELPGRRIELQQRRLLLCGEIFDSIESQRKLRERLFSPVQDVINAHSLIRDEYKLRFKASLSMSAELMSSALFDLVKQNVGEFRGEAESHAAIRKLIELHDSTTKEGVLSIASLIHNKLVEAATSTGKYSAGVEALLRTERAASDVYDLLFGLRFLEPRYTLLFQDTLIEHLSPGQRGALLLIFYLLVDKGHNPIILDQPEENLDNQTVVSLLVPVLSEAKKRRQILMVTHNPNLAVVCDAEQIIFSSFDRKQACRITYLSGAIENPSINQHVVNVLEGTKPAFDNRRDKYH